MAGNALSPQRRERTVPVDEENIEVAAVATALPCHQQRTGRARDAVAHALHQFLGVGEAQFEAGRDLVVRQSLPGKEMEHLLFALGEAGHGLVDERGKFAAVVVAREVGIDRLFGCVLLANVTRTRTSLGAHFVAHDGVHPCAELRFVAQLADAASHNEHRVVHDIGGKRRVAQLAAGEVVELVGVEVVERGKALVRTRTQSLDDRAVLAVFHHLAPTTPLATRAPLRSMPRRCASTALADTFCPFVRKSPSADARGRLQ